MYVCYLRDMVVRGVRLVSCKFRGTLTEKVVDRWRPRVHTRSGYKLIPSDEVCYKGAEK